MGRPAVRVKRLPRLDKAGAAHLARIGTLDPGAVAGYRRAVKRGDNLAFGVWADGVRVASILAQVEQDTDGRRFFVVAEMGGDPVPGLRLVEVAERFALTQARAMRCQAARFLTWRRGFARALPDWTRRDLDTGQALHEREVRP